MSITPTHTAWPHRGRKSQRQASKKQPRDGGALADVGDQKRRKVTVTWTPAALNARLSAERALQAFPRRSAGICAEARVTLTRIVARVEQGELAPHAAAEQLRQLTGRLLLLQQAQAAVSRRPEWRPTVQRHAVG